MTWLLILIAYQAPPDAVNWNGPWAIGITHVMDEHYRSEAACRRAAVQAMDQLHQGMRAPLRYRCVPVEVALREGAPR
jgi:hypothetical protein